MSESVVLLHGFAGTARTWDGVLAALPPERYRPLPLDLPGHGPQAAAASPITFAECVRHVLSRSPEGPFTLCGYSLGGRVALHVALAAPQRLRGLVLISTSAGIEDERERARRRAADERLAAEIEAGEMREFAERWRSQPLFAHQSPRVRALATEDHMRNTTGGLAAALRGIGAGAMEPLWDRLPELRMPASVIVGEQDAKYVQIGERMAELLPDGRLTILPGGHGLPLESPDAVAAAIEGRR